MRGLGSGLLPANGISPLIPTLFLSLLSLYSSEATLPWVSSLLGWTQQYYPRGWIPKFVFIHPFIRFLLSTCTVTGGGAALITKDTPESHHGAYGLLIHLPPSQDGTSFSELFQPKNHLRGWHRGKESACQGRRHRRHRFDPWVGKIP